MKLSRLGAMDFFRLFYVPVLIGEPIFASNNIVMCANQSLRYLTIDVDGSVHFCCFLTVQDVPDETFRKLRIASLQEISFEEGVHKFAEAIHRFLSDRISDYAKESIDQNMDNGSCFYCYRKLGIA